MKKKSLLSDLFLGYKKILPEFSKLKKNTLNAKFNPSQKLAIEKRKLPPKTVWWCKVHQVLGRLLFWWKQFVF